MTNEQEWWEATDEVPVSLAAQIPENEEPVDLIGEAVANEAERFLETLTPIPLVPETQVRAASYEVGDPGEGAQNPGAEVRVSRLPTFAVVLLVCLIAFAHGWHVGAGRRSPEPTRESAVTGITHQEAVGQLGEGKEGGE
jgi:hypothetical protein